MTTTCIIRGHKPLVSEAFLDAHAERLRGQVVILHKYFPENTNNGRICRYFYSRPPLFKKARWLRYFTLFGCWCQTPFTRQLPCDGITRNLYQAFAR